MADISRLVLEVDSKGVRNATDDLNRFGKTSKSTEKTVGGLSKGIGGMSKGFIAGGVAISALTVAIKGMAKFAKASISAFSEFEMVKTNLQVVTGSAEQAEKQFKDLKELASKTPFEVTGLANAGIMLQQSGVQAEELTNTLRMLGDVAGGNNEKFNRIAQNYAQILSVGKASAMDMRQFAMAGLPVMTMMKDMGIQGQATAEQVTEMFKKMTKEGGTFFNGMELQAGTLAGKTSTLKDTWKDFMATFAESTGLADIWKSVLDDLTKRIQAQTDAMEKNREGLKIAQDFYTGGVLGQGTYYQKVIEEQKAIFEAYGITLEQIEKSTDLAGDFGILAQEVQVYKDAVKEMGGIQEQYDYQVKILQIEEDRLKVNKELLTKQQEQANNWEGVYQGIKEELAEEQDSEIERIKNRISELKGYLEETKVSYFTDSQGRVRAGSTTEKVFQGQARDDIETLLKILEDKLLNLLKGILPKDWFDYFKEVTGVDISSLRGVSGSGIKASMMYKQGKASERQFAKDFNKMFGEDVINIPDLLRNQRNDIVDEINQLLSLVDEEGNPLYSMADNVIKGMVNTAKEMSAEEKKLRQEGYIKGLPAQYGMSLIQGTDVGNFVQGMQQGGVWGGIINTLLGAIANVVGGLEGMNYVLSPITELFKELAPTFKSLLLPAMVFGQALKGLGKIIQVILNFLSGGLIEDMADEWDNLLNTTKSVNENMKSLTDSLLELQDAIDKQEQYYLSEKRNILAENRYTTPVNDMILTPEGKFSTNPRDTIIATKDPRGLVGSGVNITINNTQAGNVDVSTRQDNMGNLIIDISKSVARDFATGSNGWENAVNYRNDKESGRRLY